MTEPIKPVAWIWIEGAQMRNGEQVDQYEQEFVSLEKPTHLVYALTALYTATQLAERYRAIVLATLEAAKKQTDFTCRINIDPDQILKEMKL